MLKFWKDKIVDFTNFFLLTCLRFWICHTSFHVKYERQKIQQSLFRCILFSRKILFTKFLPLCTIISSTLLKSLSATSDHDLISMHFDETCKYAFSIASFEKFMSLLCFIRPIFFANVNSRYEPGTAKPTKTITTKTARNYSNQPEWIFNSGL